MLTTRPLLASCNTLLPTIIRVFNLIDMPMPIYSLYDRYERFFYFILSVPIKSFLNFCNFVDMLRVTDEDF